MRPYGSSVVVLAAALLASTPLQTSADETSTEQALWRVDFSVSPEHVRRSIEGRILVQAQDGGILLEDRGGVLWNVTPEQILHRERTNADYSRLSPDELAEGMRVALGGSAHVVFTDHYVVATAGSRLHAEWCGHLLERLFKAFLGYWRSSELDLQTPQSPLPVIIYQDRAAFAKAATKEAGVAFTDANGYYSMQTNRVSLFDHVNESLKSTDRARPIQSRADVQLLMAEAALPVSTVVHEATHQIAFNSGMHTRFADNPVWLTEGMAMFFEVPDLRSPSGWQTIGRVNVPRLRHFRESLSSGRPRAALTLLTADDARFHHSDSIETAYAEAWVLTHFLVHSHRRQYLKFLSKCSEYTPLDWKTREERLRDFEDAFGKPATEFEGKLLQYAAKLGR